MKFSLLNQTPLELNDLPLFAAHHQQVNSAAIAWAEVQLISKGRELMLAKRLQTHSS